MTTKNHTEAGNLQPRVFEVSPFARGYAVFEVIGDKWVRVSSRFRTRRSAEIDAAHRRAADARRIEEAQRIEQ